MWEVSNRERENTKKYEVLTLGDWEGAALL
jgi:hypothetical protein